MKAKQRKGTRGFSLAWTGWWISIATLLVARAVCHLSSTVECFPPERWCLMGGTSGWNAPATLLMSDWSRIPLYAAVIVLVVSIGFAIRQTSAQQPWAVVFVVVFLCLVADFDRVIPSVLLLLSTMWMREKLNAMSTVVSVLVAVLAFVCTLEFGLVWAVLFCSLFTHNSADRRARLGLLILGIVVAVVAVTVPSIGGVLIRPVSAGWWGSAISCFPKLSSPFVNGELWQAVACLVLTLGILLRGRQGDRVAALVLAGVGLSTSFYLPIIAFGLAGLFLRSASEHSVVAFSRRRGPAITCCLVVSGLLGWRQTETSNVSLLEPFKDRVVNTADWRSDNPVLLTNLDHAGLWESDGIALVINDRWDCVGQHYAGYDRVVKDLKQGRRERYLLSDGSWGGFGDALRTWNPAAIVFSSYEFAAIRQTSLDPAWSIAAIDGTRTIFASTEHSLKRHASNTMRLLYRLEWPRANANFDTEGRIILGNQNDSVAVASVLNSIRFPYAALRILPAEKTESIQAVKLWSAAEISHRTLRQAGRPNLIHHYHAVIGLRSLVEYQTGPLKELAERQLMSLSSALNRLAEEGDLVTYLQGLISPLGKKTAQNVHKQENREGFKQFGDVLHSADCGSAVSKLREMAQNATLNSGIRSEASFLAGSLLLSNGQASAAVESFQDSLRAMPDSPYRQLIRLHLSHLVGN